MMKTILIEDLMSTCRERDVPLRALVEDTDGGRHRVKAYPSGRVVDIDTGKANNDIPETYR